MLKKGNINLRALEPDDAAILYRWENDSNNWLVSHTNTPFSMFVLQQFIENAHLDIYTTKQLRLMIEFSENGIVKRVGCIDLFDYDIANKRAGVGILIGEQDYKRKGIAGVALELFIAYCFTQLQLHQLYCNIMPQNKPSMALFTKKGFEVVGLKQDWILSSGQWYDEYLLQLINK